MTWKDDSAYPVCEQLHPPFSRAVSILDLLLRTAPNAPYLIWGWRAARRVTA